MRRSLENPWVVTSRLLWPTRIEASYSNGVREGVIVVFPYYLKRWVVRLMKKHGVERVPAVKAKGLLPNEDR